MKTKLLLTLFGASLLIAGGVITAEDKAEKNPLKGIKCVVSGKDINPEASVDYKGGKVYFCCEGCPGAFKKDTAKFAAKANHQLVATGQFEEVKCPIAGRKLNPATKIDVAGVAVSFCCNNCKGKATKVEGAEQLELIFNDKAFEKGFAKVKAEKEGAE